jgi:hypothetical protein
LVWFLHNVLHIFASKYLPCKLLKHRLQSKFFFFKSKKKQKKFIKLAIYRKFLDFYKKKKMLLYHILKPAIFRLFLYYARPYTKVARLSKKSDMVLKVSRILLHHFSKI